MVKTVTESSEDMSTGVVKPSPEMVPRTSAKRTVPAQMYGGERTNERYNPDFGDNTFARREQLSSSHEGVVVPTSPAYSDEEKPNASDQFEPFFGDNTYGRREGLSSSHEGVVVPTSPVYSDEEKPRASDQFEPFFGDNTYGRRAELSKK